MRNHLPVPHIDVEDYNLEIGGIGLRETSLTLDDLKTKFPKVSVTAAIQCAGNRRADMTKVIFQIHVKIFLLIEFINFCFF